jgi:dTDP-4-dehydrorhamnose 3,5-epimerase-like enzyme
MDNPRLITLPKFDDNRGNLSFIEEELHIPFKIIRTYWVYDIPGGQTRGGHAFKSQSEFIISLSGSFDLLLKDSISATKYTLNRSNVGLYIPSGFWREMNNFSTNSVVLVLSSAYYDEADYIRDFESFKNFRDGK